MGNLVMTGNHIVFLEEKKAFKFILEDGSKLPLCLSKREVTENAGSLLMSERITEREYDKMVLTINSISNKRFPKYPPKKKKEDKAKRVLRDNLSSVEKLGKEDKNKRVLQDNLSGVKEFGENFFAKLER